LQPFSEFDHPRAGFRKLSQFVLYLYAYLFQIQFGQKDLHGLRAGPGLDLSRVNRPVGFVFVVGEDIAGFFFDLRRDLRVNLRDNHNRSVVFDFAFGVEHPGVMLF